MPRWGPPMVNNSKVCQELRPRVRRWTAETHDTSLEDTRRVLELLKTLASTISANVAYAFLQSVCYGWQTDRRFRNFPIRPCVWGCNEQDSGDDFYHYYSCPVICKCLQRLGLDFVPPGQSLLRHFLLLEGGCQLPLRLVFLHAAMTSVHQLRGPHSHVFVGNRERHIRGIFRDTVSRNNKLKTLYAQLQQERSYSNTR